MSDLLDEGALAAHMALSQKLHEWAGTAHRLVVERVEALQAVHPDDHPGGETAREWAERVLAHQSPFPDGYSIYSDLNCNTGYDHVEVSYGFHVNPGGMRVQYTGRYHVWDKAGDDLVMRTAQIDVPTWLMTDPDGAERYRRETAAMVQAATVERDAERARLDAFMNRVLDEMKAEHEARIASAGDEAHCESQGCHCTPSLPCDETGCDGRQHDDGSGVACTMCVREREEMLRGEA